MVLLYAFVAICALSGVLCDESTKHDCSTVQTQANFNFSKLIGSWHLARVSENSEDEIAKCVKMYFQLDENNSKKLIVSGLFADYEERTNQTLYLLDNPTEPAKLSVVFNLARPEFKKDFWILGTDYETYVIIYNCNQYHNKLNDHAFILVKNEELAEEVVSTASTIAKKQGLINTQFIPSTCN